MRRLLALAALLVACVPPEDGSGDGGTTQRATHAIDAIRFCNRYVTECKIETSVTVQACIDQYTPARVTADCAAKIESATCSDFDDAFTATCFPSCSFSGDRCSTDGTTITTCDGNRRAHTYACEGVCSAQKTKYSGTCGTTYQSDVSQTPKCWCTL